MQYNKNKFQKLNKRKFIMSLLSISIMFFSFYILNPEEVSSNQTQIEALNREIDQKRTEIEKLTAEINEQRRALDAVSGQSRTLQNTINELERTRERLQSDIRVTQNEIVMAELTIDKLSLEIQETESVIHSYQESLASLFRQSNQIEQKTFAEMFLSNNSMQDFWVELELTSALQNTLTNEINNLLELKDELSRQELEKSTAVNNLSKQITILAGETEVIQMTASEQAELLRRTRNEEAAYQRILNEKLAQKRAFEEEMLQIESQINILIDPASFPSPRRGLLAWPLDNIRITQQFGGTQFAATNPHIYGRPFHPGVDFAAPIGTQIKSVDAGVVKAMGNTDDFPGCFAWGRWLLIDHDNGLTSLYAHLSRNLVTVGQRVSRGEVVALSGNTGFSTGPHLHLTIYASQGVRVGPYTGSGGCASAGAIGPFADLEAYLDPMLYLPNN